MTYTNFTRPLWGWLSEPERESSYFGLPFRTIPSYTGEQFVAAHNRFVAGFPWRTRLGTMNALDTHDTPRFLTNARAGVVPVALGMSMTLPGIPVVFAGDEFGLTGIDGEDSRTPLPWESLADASVSATVDLYSALIRLRTEHSALNGGGMRWLHVGENVLVYGREDAAESVLLVAARAGFDVLLPVDAVGGADVASSLFGHGELEASEVGIRLRGSGPMFAAWALPGVALPEYSAARI
jgi:alpha-glucosidase